MKKLGESILKVCIDFIITDKKRLWISFDTGILLMGTFLCWLDIYIKSASEETNDFRAFLGGACISLWFFLFPLIKMEEKDKIVKKILFHFLMAIGMLVLLICELEYLLKNISGGTKWEEFLFCIGGIFIFTYLCYIFIGFVKTFIYLLEKLRIFIFSKMEERVSGLVKMLETITAIAVSITTLGTSIIGMLALGDQIKQLFN